MMMVRVVVELGGNERGLTGQNLENAPEQLNEQPTRVVQCQQCGQTVEQEKEPISRTPYRMELLTVQ